MKNIIDEKPTPPDQLHGRLLHTTHVVADADIAGKRVLDIGCGFGWFELFALSKGASWAVGIEPAPADLKVARKHLSGDKVSLLSGSAIALPFVDGAFDTVVCWEVLEHIPKGTEPQYFAEVRRVLRPGGTCYLSTPMHSLPSVIFDPAYWLIAHRHYSPAQLRALAKGAGLCVREVQPAGGWLEILSWWNLYVMKWVFRRRPLLSRVVNPHLDQEFERGDGFANLFCRLQTSDT